MCKGLSAVTIADMRMTHQGLQMVNTIADLNGAVYHTRLSGGVALRNRPGLSFPDEHAYFD